MAVNISEDAYGAVGFLCVSENCRPRLWFQRIRGEQAEAFPLT